MKNIFDEIVFQGKNKLYGAYVMRNRYNRSLSNSLWIAILVFVISSFYILIASPNAFDRADEELLEDIAAYEQYSFLKDMDSIKVNAAPPKKKVTLNSSKEVVVVDSIKKSIDTVRTIKTPDIKNDSLLNDTTAISDTARSGSNNGLEDGLIFWTVDELPEFPGGSKARLQFILAVLKYPEEAIKKKIAGVVEIQFVVTGTGAIEKVSVKKGAHPIIDNEALRIVKLFPKWKPAKRRGKPVSSWMIQVFNFQP